MRGAADDECESKITLEPAGGRREGGKGRRVDDLGMSGKASEEAIIKVDKEAARLRMKDIEGVEVGSLIRR